MNRKIDYNVNNDDDLAKKKKGVGGEK